MVVYSNDIGVSYKTDVGLFVWFWNVFVSPAKQKRDMCTAFPASSLSSSSSSAAA